MSYVAVWDGTQMRRAGVPQDGPTPVAHDWTELNPPWSDTGDESVLTAGWPTTTIANLPSSGGSFRARLDSVCNAYPGGVVVRLPAGDFQLTSFEMIGGSGDPLYAFGYWHPNLRGFLGAGVTKTSVTMAANSMTSTQLTEMARLTKAAFAPLQMGMMRIDSASGSPVRLAGLTLRAADQQLLTAVASDVDITLPQPAPHQGIVLYPNTGASSIIQHVRFQACGRAAMGQPPFEMANISSQRGTHTIRNVEVDGRRAPALDPSRPRRCAPIMMNNESGHTMTDVWLHDSNLGRYAVNDQNSATTGPYTLTRVKSERMADTRNIDPVYGNLGGYGPAPNFGFEDVNGVLTFNDPIIHIDNSDLMWGGGKHIDLTSVGARNPAGGRLYVYGGTFTCPWPGLDGFLLLRPHQATPWWTDGLSTTIHVYDAPGGTRKLPWRWVSQAETGVAWPPPAGWLAGQGITPATHYVIRTA